MISLVRLDERMIHGQVAIKWSRHLSIDRIIVISDAAAGNPVIQKSLMMAAPPTAKATVKGVEDAIALLNDPRGEQYKILVIVSTPKDLLRVIEGVPAIQAINVGNYGRIASKIGLETRKTYRPNLYAYSCEVDIFKQIMEKGIKCYYQTTPEESKEDLSTIFNEQ